MDNNDISKLLEYGIVTQEEYDSIVKRLNDIENNVTHSYSEVLAQYRNDLIKTKYNARTISRTVRNAELLVRFILKINNQEDNLGNIFEAALFNTDSCNLYFTKNLSQNINAFVTNTTDLKSFIRFLNRNYNTKIDDSYINSIRYKANKQYQSNKEEIISFTEKEIQDMLMCVDNPHKIAILLCYEAGTTRDELADVKFGDFDLENHIFHLRERETENVRRDVKISDALCAAVKEYHHELDEMISRWNESRIKNDKSPRIDTDYVFQNRKSAYPTIATLDYRLREINKSYYNWKYEEENSNLEFEEYLKKQPKISYTSIKASRIINALKSGKTIKERTEGMSISERLYISKKYGRFAN